MPPPVLSFIAGFVILSVPGVISPGTVSTAVVTAGARQGARVGLLVSTGHAAMEYLLVIGMALGFSRLMQMPAIEAFIALAGGLLMVFMGLSMLWGVWRGKLNLPAVDDQQPPIGTMGLVWLGVGATLGNPFWYGWWVSIGAPYVVQARQMGWAIVLLMITGHISVDYIWNTFLAGVVGSGRRWMTNTVYRALLAAAGLFLIYIGLNFLLRAARLTGLLAA